MKGFLYGIVAGDPDFPAGVSSCFHVDGAGVEEGLEAGGLDHPPAASGANDADEISRSGFQDVIDDQKVVPGCFLHFRPAGAEAGRDLFGGFRASRPQPLLESVPGGWQDKDVCGRRIKAANLARSLNIDIEQHVVAGSQPFIELRLVGTVVFPMHLSPFQEPARLNPGQEGFPGDEVVVLAVAFLGSGRAGGAGYRKPQGGHFPQQGPNEGGLPDPGRGRDYEELSRMAKAWHTLLILFPLWQDRRLWHGCR